MQQETFVFAQEGMGILNAQLHSTQNVLLILLTRLSTKAVKALILHIIFTRCRAMILAFS